MIPIHVLERQGWGAMLPVLQTPEDMHCHTYLIGKSGTGKSTLLSNMILRQIYSGEGISLIDPHGDLAEAVLDRIPSFRAHDTIYFNPADTENPFALNVLRANHNPTVLASYLVSAIKNIWVDSWGPRLEYILYASIAALAECQNTTLLGIPRLLTDSVYRNWVVCQVKDPVVHAFWANEYAKYDPRFRNEAIAPILNKIGQFSMSPLLRNILGQVRNRVDFEKVVRNRQIFIANLSKGIIGEGRARLLGSLLVSQFEMASLSQAQEREAARAQHYLFIDEFQNFVTETFCNILSESRKYGLHLTLSNQYINQLRPEVKEAVFGNARGIVSFQVGYADAEALAGELGTFSPAQFAELAKYEVIAKLQTNGFASEPFLAQTLPPLGESQGRMPGIIANNRQKFASRREIVENRIERWMNNS